MACTIGPCPTCDGTGKATSNFWRRKERRMDNTPISYVDDSHLYSRAGWLFVDGKCRHCGGGGIVPWPTSLLERLCAS